MGMRDDLKIPLTMLSINFLNKLKFKGSYNGKRFMFEKHFDKDDKGTNIDSTLKLRVYIWKDIFNFENTDKKDIKTFDFPFTKEGIDSGLKLVEETEV